MVFPRSLARFSGDDRVRNLQLLLGGTVEARQTDKTGSSFHVLDVCKPFIHFALEQVEERVMQKGPPA